MGGHEELVDEGHRASRRQIRPISFIIMKNASVNPANTHKATTVEELCRVNFVAL